MRRLIPFLMIVSACGGAVGEAVATTEGSVVTEATAVPATSEETTPTTEGQPSPATTDSGRPVAPDFTLELNDGGSYTLSEGEKPVYLVFWAEW